MGDRRASQKYTNIFKSNGSFENSLSWFRQISLTPSKFKSKQTFRGPDVSRYLSLYNNYIRELGSEPNVIENGEILIELNPHETREIELKEFQQHAELLDNKARDKEKIEESSRKRKLTMQELYEKEKDYVKYLKDIVEGYIRIMKDEESRIPMPDCLKGRAEMVFGNIEHIYEWHRDVFFKELENCMQTPKDLAEFFKKQEHKFSLYVPYVSNKPISERLLSIEEICSYFLEIQNILNHKLTLSSLLIKPIQHVQQYHLLLEKILKYTKQMGNDDEVEPLQEALRIMQIVPKHIDNMMNIGRIHGFNGKITPNDKLLKCGSLFCCKEHSAKSRILNSFSKKAKVYEVFLFEQFIIFCQPVEKKTQYTNPNCLYKAHLQVNNMTLIDILDGSNKFILKSGNSKSFICQTWGREMKEEWIKEIERILRNQRNLLTALESPIEYQKNIVAKTITN